MKKKIIGDFFFYKIHSVELNGYLPFCKTVIYIFLKSQLDVFSMQNRKDFLDLFILISGTID